MTTPPFVRLLTRHDAHVLHRVAPEVFDSVLDARLTAEFLADARHHLAVALEDDIVVGMASAVHYVHPDKEPQLFVNEVAVAPTHHGRGIGRQLMECLVRLAGELNCTEAWVLTSRANTAAQRLYESAGGKTPPDDCIMYTIPVFRTVDTALSSVPS
jgi:ribosomal protein S18 acetylase RimI-like enzyme